MTDEQIGQHLKWSAERGCHLQDITCGFTFNHKRLFVYHLFSVDGLLGDCDLAVFEHLAINPQSDEVSQQLGAFADRHKNADYHCWFVVDPDGEWSLMSEYVNGVKHWKDYSRSTAWLRAMLVHRIATYHALGHLPEPDLTVGG